VSQGKRKTRIPVRSKKDWQEIVAVTLNQRRHADDGSRIPGFSLEEIAAMTQAERERVKQAGSDPHRPLASDGHALKFDHLALP
jgi:hypothetical protein